MDKNYAQQILKQNRESYNKIAEEFSRTRFAIWKDLEPLLQYSTRGDKVLDLGCGNGRLFEALKDRGVEYLGADDSEELIKIARQKYPEANFQIADGLNLPFEENSLDKIYCIAVFHHIPSKGLRQQFLKEAKRVLKPEGLLILTVWKLGQWKSLKLVLKYSFLKIIGKNKMDFGDMLVPWGKAHERYVHNFSEKGLKKLLQQAGFQIEKIGTLWRPKKKNANIFAVTKKPL